MIPHNLVGRFIYVKPCLSKFGPVGEGRWVFLAHVRSDGVMLCFSMKDGGLVQHRYPQEGNRAFTAVASKRDDAAAEEMIRWLNEKLADPNNTLVDPAGALEVRDLIVKVLQASVEADIEAKREEEDEIIQARFHELGKPVTPWKPEPMPVMDEPTCAGCGCACGPEAEPTKVYANTILLGGLPVLTIVGSDEAEVQAVSQSVADLLRDEFEINPLRYGHF